jgi:hypothetical protein
VTVSRIARIYIVDERSNNSPNTDLPLQEAASPKMWQSGCLGRYAS